MEIVIFILSLFRLCDDFPHFLFPTSLPAESDDSSSDKFDCPIFFMINKCWVCGQGEVKNYYATFYCTHIQPLHMSHIYFSPWHEYEWLNMMKQLMTNKWKDCSATMINDFLVTFSCLCLGLIIKLTSSVIWSSLRICSEQVSRVTALSPDPHSFHVFSLFFLSTPLISTNLCRCSDTPSE